MKAERLSESAKRRHRLPWHRWTAILALPLLFSSCCEDETPPMQTYGYGPVSTLVALPDGRRFVSGGSGGAFVWDIESRKVIHRFVTGANDVVAVSPDGSRILTGGQGWAYNDPDVMQEPVSSYHLWNTETGHLVSAVGGGIQLDSWAPWSVTFSADSSRLLLVGYDYLEGDGWEGSRVGIARLCDVTNGQLLHTLEFAGRIENAALSPCGTRLVTQVELSQGADPMLILTELEHGQLVLSLPIDSAYSRAYAFSPDGHKLATIRRSNGGDAVFVWNAENGQLLSLLHDTEAIRDIAFSPDGSQILTRGQAARLWDADTGECLHALQHPDALRFAAFSPDASQVLTLGDVANLWDAHTGTLVHSLEHPHPLEDAEFSSDGSRVLLRGGHVAGLWDVEVGAELQTIDYGAWDDGWAESVVFSPDGSKVMATVSSYYSSYYNLDNYYEGYPEPRLWDANSGALLGALSGAAAHPLAFLPDGDHLLKVSLEDSAVCLWNLPKMEPVAHYVGHAVSIPLTAFSSDGSRVFTVSGTDYNGPSVPTVCQWEAASGRLVWSFQCPYRVEALAIALDGSVIVTCGSQYVDYWTPGLAVGQVWDAETGEEILEFTEARGTIQSVAISPDGAVILTGVGSGAAVMRDARTGQEIRAFEQLPGSVGSVAFSPDGTQIAISGRTVEIRDALSGAFIRTLDENQGGAVAFSPDGTKVLAGSFPVRLWDVTSGELLREYLSAVDSSYNDSVAFSPDGRFVLATSVERVYAHGGNYDHYLSVELWDSTTGEPIYCFQGGQSCAFHPNGSVILTGGADGAGYSQPGFARLYDIRRFTGGLRTEGTGADAEVAWERGILQSADRIHGPWTDVTNAVSPLKLDLEARMKFYRLRIGEAF